MSPRMEFEKIAGRGRGILLKGLILIILPVDSEFLHFRL